MATDICLNSIVLNTNCSSVTKRELNIKDDSISKNGIELKVREIPNTLLLLSMGFHF